MRRGRADEIALIIAEIEELEKKLASVRKRLILAALRRLPPGGPDVQKRPHEITGEARRPRIVSAANAIRLALMMSSGKGDYSSLMRTAAVLSQSGTRELSSVPAKLVEKGELLRTMDHAGHPSYETRNMLDTIGAIRKDPVAFDLLKGRVLSTPGQVYSLVSGLLKSYGREKKTFLVRDFLQTVDNVGDQQVREIVQNALPSVLSEFSAKGVIELTEGLEGLLVGGRPVSRITWRERYGGTSGN